MSDSPLGTCRSCGANVFWLKNEMSGRTAPIDADPNDKGNVIVDLEHGTYTVTSAALQGLPGSRYTNHFQTCSDQARWRRRRANHG